MKTAALIFPHQLFTKHPVFDSNPHTIFLIENPLFFGNDDHYPLRMHAQKLILHRASMQSYYDQISDHYNTEYVDQKTCTKIKTVIQKIKSAGFTHLSVVDPTDFILSKRIKNAAKDENLIINWFDSPNFLNTVAENKAYRSTKKRWFMADFYQWQRKRLNILVDEQQQPIGGRWSFDEENRKKIPKKSVTSIPTLDFPNENQYVIEAKQYVKKYFPQTIGSYEQFYYPINETEAKKWFAQFLVQRFEHFGPYEDAIVEHQNWLYHSILTPMLNIGLLSPQYIVDTALQFAQDFHTPLNSLEGFIRQIIGWREFMRATYEDLGVTMRNGNAWNHHRSLPACFYTGNTSIKPIDDTIQRVLKTGYCHHIERLMVLGGFLFLCEIHPKEIYQWFMELFVDSYDWVMVPNVYAMSQNADGGLITTKPYFSGSNYVRKMSHHQADDWSDIWDGLYWRWIFKHADSLRKNPRWAMMVRMADKMDEAKKQKHLLNAQRFLVKIE